MSLCLAAVPPDSLESMNALSKTTRGALAMACFTPSSCPAQTGDQGHIIDRRASSPTQNTFSLDFVPTEPSGREDDERGPRPQRSSVTLEWSDGSKAIFIRPPRSQAGFGWGSPSEPSSSPPPPPPLPPLPLPAAPVPPRPGHSSPRSPVPQSRQGDPSYSVSNGISRQSNGGPRQGTPRPNHGRNEASSSIYSQDIPSRRRSMRHGTSTPQPTTATNNVVLGQNINRPQSVPAHTRSSRYDLYEQDGSVLDGVDSHSTTAVVGRRNSAARPSDSRRDRSQIQHGQRQPERGQADTDPSQPIFVNLKANIRGGSGRSPRQNRAGERENQSADRRNNEHKSGVVLRGLRRCFPFSHWLFGENKTSHKREGSPSGYRSRRTQKYSVEVRY
ncbi:hypothetical protein F4678DRAFT_477820 [Xylaria arbuscula]|nr:hypothetical protein F4678DRAFT_477820 [Xylaria arbuscula]